jgi:superfamily II DNA or RNA helicase
MYPYFPSGLVPKCVRICQKYQYTPYVKDLRAKPELGFPELKAIPLRDYQEAAVESGIRLGRGVFDCPPRSGKTRLACELQRRIALPTIWIAPTDRIVDQTAKVIAECFGRNYGYHLVGSSNWKEASRHNIVICTMATAANLSQEFYDTRQLIIVDEFHHSSAASFTKAIFPKCDHIYYRYGLSGTFFRSGFDAMAMHGILSNVIYKVTSTELLRRGFLVPTKVAFVPMPAHPKLRGAGAQFSGGFGKHGIHEHAYRNQLAANAALLLYQMGRKVLSLVGTKAQGREINHRPQPERNLSRWNS